MTAEQALRITHRIQHVLAEIDTFVGQVRKTNPVPQSLVDAVEALREHVREDLTGESPTTPPAQPTVAVPPPATNGPAK